MDLAPLIHDLAAQADDVLAHTNDRRQARAELADFVALEYPRLDAAARGKIVAGALDFGLASTVTRQVAHDSGKGGCASAALVAVSPRR